MGWSRKKEIVNLCRGWYDVKKGFALWRNKLMPDSVKDAEMKSLHDILEEITGIIPDTGKTLEEYREERILERYGVSIPVSAECDAAD